MLKFVKPEYFIAYTLHPKYHQRRLSLTKEHNEIERKFVVENFPNQYNYFVSFQSQQLIMPETLKLETVRQILNPISW